MTFKRLYAGSYAVFHRGERVGSISETARMGWAIRDNNGKGCGSADTLRVAKLFAGALV